MVTAVSVGGALTRLLRPEEDPLLEVLDAWPLTVADVLGESAPSADVRSSPGGLSVALERLLRPDRHVVLLTICSLDVPGERAAGGSTAA